MMRLAAMIVLAAALGPVPGGPAWSAEPDSTSAVAGPDSVSVDLVFGTDVDRETRRIVDQADAFGPDVERVFCLTRVRGLGGDTTVTHAWYHEGETKARVDLPVRAAHWRTWSSKRILPTWTGAWEVKVLDADGTVLASASFEIR